MSVVIVFGVSLALFWIYGSRDFAINMSIIFGAFALVELVNFIIDGKTITKKFHEWMDEVEKWRVKLVAGLFIVIGIYLYGQINSLRSVLLLQANSGLKIIFIAVIFFQSIDALSQTEKVVWLAGSDPQPVQQHLRWKDLFAAEIYTADPGVCRSPGGTGLLSAEAQIMLEIEPAAVVTLVGAAECEISCKVVFADEYLIRAVDQVHGIDQPKVSPQVLSHREAGTGIGVSRHKIWLNTNTAESESLLRCTGEAAAQLTGEIRHGMLLGNIQAGSPCLLQSAPRE